MKYLLVMALAISAFSNLRAQKGFMAIEAHGAQPIGKFSDSHKFGFGGGLHGELSITSNLSGLVSFGYTFLTRVPYLGQGEGGFTYNPEIGFNDKVFQFAIGYSHSFYS